MIFSIICLTLTFTPKETQAYRYIHQQCGFSIDFPESPYVETIWGDIPFREIPYIPFETRTGAIGERIYYILIFLSFSSILIAYTSMLKEAFFSSKNFN